MFPSLPLIIIIFLSKRNATILGFGRNFPNQINLPCPLPTDTDPIQTKSFPFWKIKVRLFIVEGFLHRCRLLVEISDFRDCGQEEWPPLLLGLLGVMSLHLLIGSNLEIGKGSSRGWTGLRFIAHLLLWGILTRP